MGRVDTEDGVELHCWSATGWIFSRKETDPEKVAFLRQRLRTTTEQEEELRATDRASGEKDAEAAVQI